MPWLKSSKIQQLPKTSNISALSVSYLHQCHITERVCPSVFRVHSWVWGSHGQGRPLPEADINAIFLNVTCWPLPCMPYIHLVTYRYADAPFTGVLKNFTTSSKNSGHGVNFRITFEISGISGQRPGLINTPIIPSIRSHHVVGYSRCKGQWHRFPFRSHIGCIKVEAQCGSVRWRHEGHPSCKLSHKGAIS